MQNKIPISSNGLKGAEELKELRREWSCIDEDVCSFLDEAICMGFEFGRVVWTTQTFCQRFGRIRLRNVTERLRDIGILFSYPENEFGAKRLEIIGGSEEDKAEFRTWARNEKDIARIGPNFVVTKSHEESIDWLISEYFEKHPDVETIELPNGADGLGSLGLPHLLFDGKVRETCKNDSIECTDEGYLVFAWDWYPKAYPKPMTWRRK